MAAPPAFRHSRPFYSKHIPGWRFAYFLDPSKVRPVDAIYLGKHGLKVFGVIRDGGSADALQVREKQDEILHLRGIIVK